jgi:hypothetical protein
MLSLKLWLVEFKVEDAVVRIGRLPTFRRLVYAGASVNRRGEVILRALAEEALTKRDLRFFFPGDPHPPQSLESSG